jgi:hypothetical protein
MSVFINGQIKPIEEVYQHILVDDTVKNILDANFSKSKSKSKGGKKNGKRGKSKKNKK